MPASSPVQEDHPDGVSLILHYDVPVTPAIIAGEKGDAVNHAHVTLDDQKAYEKRLKDNGADHGQGAAPSGVGAGRPPPERRRESWQV